MIKKGKQDGIQSYWKYARFKIGFLGNYNRPILMKFGCHINWIMLKIYGKNFYFLRMKCFNLDQWQFFRKKIIFQNFLYIFTFFLIKLIIFLNCLSYMNQSISWNRKQHFWVFFFKGNILIPQIQNNLNHFS